ncbi:hypothetical protein [Streptomyces sp. NPDC051636]
MIHRPSGPARNADDIGHVGPEAANGFNITVALLPVYADRLFSAR